MDGWNCATQGGRKQWRLCGTEENFEERVWRGL